jgi:carbamoyltransferase
MRILSIGLAHDASVCSLNEGKIEFFCKEERLSRVKRDKHPFKSLELFRSLNFGKVDHILYNTPTNNELDVFSTYAEYLYKTFDTPVENYSSLKHHECHAVLAFVNSQFEEAIVVVIDRNGSILFINGNSACREAESVYHFSKKETHKSLYKNFWKMPSDTFFKQHIKEQLSYYFQDTDVFVNSSYGIVKVYEAATTLIGQHVLENGKTMGLASYGTDKEYEPLFLNQSAIENYFTHDEEFNTHFVDHMHLVKKDVDPTDYQLYADKAKHVQIETQKAALNLIQMYVEKTGIKNVCLVGGYGLNVVANNYYIKNLPNVNFYFEPVADDTGISIGATYLKHREVTGTYPEAVENNFYHYYDSSEKLDEGKSSDIDELCDILIDQKSLAIFDGNPEAGPRALGHRSILFDPRNENAKEIVNKIKKREWYRPFAGVILKDHFEEYFETLGLKDSPYMTINFDCKESTKDFVPGIVHVDNTCRIQTVSEGFLFDLLTKFYEKTGCPMLLNTSFNLAGEALVQTKKDAIKTLNDSELNHVYFVDENKLC